MSTNVHKFLNPTAPSVPATADTLYEADMVATGEVVVTSSVGAQDLRSLLDCLAREDCVHSWRNFGPGGTLDELLRWENQRRPTELFFFYLKRGDQTQMIAAGAVAFRLTREFPHPGFCVLGRCCIMPEFRGQGLYRHILHHRLEYCRAQFGSALNAIHIGAVDERVSRVITNHGLPGWPAFIHLGEERLQVAGQIRPVSAYILLVPDYVRRLQSVLAGAHAPPCVIELRRELSMIGSGTSRNLGLLVKRTFEEASEQRWFAARDPREIEQLLLFCRSIPLVGFREGASPENRTGESQCEAIEK